MRQQCVRQAQIAFRIFEINRIDLVRHGGRSDFIFLDSLLEIADRNITPDISIEIEQNGIESRDCIEQLRDAVVGFYLSGIRIEFKTKFLDETSAERFPVEVRKSCKMCVEIADRPVHFSG